MFKAGLAFLLGASCLLLFSSLPPVWAYVCILPVFLFCFYDKKFLICIWAILGFAFSHYTALKQLSERLPAHLESKVIELEGTIISLPNKSDRRQSFTFAVDDVAKLELKGKLRKIKLNWYNTKINLKLGQRWRFSVKLKQAHGAFNNGGFTYETWLWANGISATGSVRNKKSATLLPEAIINTFSIRQTYYESLNKLLKTAKNKDLFMALTVADRSKLSERNRQLFQKTGTAHLLAISGLHIGLASGFFWLLASGVWKLLARVMKQNVQAIPRPIFAAIFALCGAVFYAYLAGFSLPTKRALVVVVLCLLAIALRKRIAWQQTFGCALLLIVLLNPFSILSIGFCLSFLAVFTIAWVSYGRPSGLLFANANFNVNPGLSSFANKVLVFLRIQLALTIIMLPLLWYYFGQAALLGATANFVALPLASLVFVPLLLILLLLIPLQGIFVVGGFTKLYVAFIDKLFDYFLSLLGFFENLPAAVVSIQSISPSIVMLLLCTIFVLLLPKALPYRYWVLLCLLPLVFPQQEAISKGEFVMTVIDIGQGLSIIVQTQNKTLVYDAGPAYPSGFNAGRDIVVPVLKQARVSKVDRMVISHGDIDHRGGAAAIAENIDIQSISTNIDADYIKALSHNPSVSMDQCIRGSVWMWDGVRFEVLHPPEYWFTEDNNSSCVIKVSNHKTSVLLTGDIEWLAEFELLENTRHIDALKADILISPHHGSRTSSTKRFIDAVSPKIAIHSVGYLNSFRLPSKKVVKLYNDLAIKQYLTSETGQIRFDSTEWLEDLQNKPQAGLNQLQGIEFYRNVKKRFWYWQNKQAVY